MAERQFDIQAWSGGEADDKYKGPADSFYEAQNIEIRKNLSGVQLAPKMVDTGWTFDDDITFMIDLENLGVTNGGIVVCLENGKIFLDGTLKTTLSTGTTAFNQIIGIGVNTDLAGTQYVYYVSKSSFGTAKIHRSTTSLGTFNVSYRELIVSTGSAEKAILINSAGILYIGYRNKVFIMEKNEIVLDYLSLADDEEIKYISQYLGTYRIYSNRINTGIQYIWDGASELATQRQEFSNRPFLGGTSEGAYDYMVVGYNQLYADLVRFAGTQMQEIRVNLEASVESREFYGYLSVREGIVYISGGRSGQSDEYGVYTYGNYYPGTSKSLVLNYALADDRFTFHAHSEIYSYFACVDNKVYKIEHNNPPASFADSGYVVSEVYNGAIWEELSLEDLRIAFETNGGTIRIYVRTSFTIGSSFSLIKEITNASYGTKKYCKVNRNEWLSTVSLGSQEEYQFKIELIRGATTNNTPVVKRFTAFFKTDGR